MATLTIRDVARKAAVGVGTVSRVLNNNPKVSPQTRERVLAAIAELGFKPNSIARMLPRKTRIHNIGVITQPFISFRSFAERLRGVQRALYGHDTQHELVLYNASSLPHYDERLRAIVQLGAVEGLIIIDLDLHNGQKQMLLDARLPFVGINHFRGRDWPCIGTDNVEGGYRATRHLLDLGHRYIAYLGDEFVDTYGFNTSVERLEGCRKALDEVGLTLPQHYIRVSIHDYDAAREQAANLLMMPDRPTAVFAMSDIQALACITAARQLGLRIPDDLSVIGYDDLEVSMHIGLTTVRQHLELSGRIALEYLLRLIDGDEAPPPSLPPLEVIIRQTTKAVA
jgi:LacI family transcriptional regulator, galactose operon repressor